MPAIAPRWIPSFVVPPCDVVQVGVERLDEEVPRTLAVALGLIPRVHDTAQGRAVRRSRLVVLDHPVEQSVVPVVAEPFEQGAELVA